MSKEEKNKNEEEEKEIKEDSKNETENFEEAEEDSSNDKNDTDEEIKSLENKLLRLQADFTNYRRRTEKEKSSSINYGKEVILSEIFPILDNFKRALDNIEDKEDSVYEGVNMIYTQLLDMLKKQGVEKIECIGKDFDPNLHEAVLMQDSDEYESGKVIESLEEGYIFNDRVIKPATVIVAE